MAEHPSIQGLSTFTDQRDQSEARLIVGVARLPLWIFDSQESDTSHVEVAVDSGDVNRDDLVSTLQSVGELVAKRLPIVGFLVGDEIDVGGLDLHEFERALTHSRSRLIVSAREAQPLASTDVRATSHS